MVAASFAEKRREIAAKIGLGRKRVAPADAVPEAALKSPEEVAAPVTKPKRSDRKPRQVKPAEEVPAQVVTAPVSELEAGVSAKPERVARKARGAAVTAEPGTQEAVAVTPKRAAAKAKSSTSAKEGTNKSGRKTARASAAEKPVRAKKSAVSEGTSPAPQE
jgi:predicted transcriptional regulator